MCISRYETIVPIIEEGLELRIYFYSLFLSSLREFCYHSYKPPHPRARNNVIPVARVDQERWRIIKISDFCFVIADSFDESKYMLSCKIAL